MRPEALPLWGKTVESHKPAFKCFCSEVTRITSAQVLLAKSSPMITSNFQGIGKVVFLCIEVQGGQEMLVNT